ncbi:hypothetical protein GJ744_008633 [Endocarpon pusillum]|uniref:Uncharacterized protein n=1 Tax=Endocarpon pusillum TaxID=364733 RepID=A0A8H7AK78_9EURO|nr:hypothetical protein GJ744_008633 [Endocarpon pusillum]
MPPTSPRMISETDSSDDLPFSNLSLQAERVSADQDVRVSPPCPLDHEPCELVYIPLQRQLGGVSSYRYSTILSAEEAAQKLKVLCESISKHHDGLKRCLVGKKDGILKKWKSWTTERRQATILGTCPNIASKRFVQDVQLGKITNPSSFQTQFMLFPMTAETFAENVNALLGFTHVRTSTRPEDCVPFDWEQLRRGINLYAFPKTFAPGCVVVFGDDFGNLEPFDEVKVHCNDALATPAALLVLERQSMIYEMLYKVVSPIANSIKEDKGSSKWDDLAARDFRKCEDTHTLYQHIDGIALSTIPDISVISTLVQGRKEYYEDELASLSSDLEYFGCLVAEFEEMRDTDTRPEHEQPPEATVTILILGAFQDLLCWHFLSEALTRLLAAMQSQKNNLRCGQPRSIEYQKAFSRFSSLVQQMIFKVLEDLHVFSISSPLIMKRTTRSKRQVQTEAPTSDPPWTLTGYKSDEALCKADRLLWLFTKLWSDFRNIPFVLPELNKLLLKKDEGKRVNFRTMHSLSEIGDLWRLFEFCQYQRPAVPYTNQGFLQDDECLTARCLVALQKGEIPADMLRQGLLDRQFEELRGARQASGERRASLPAVEKSRRQLQDTVSLALILFLGMLKEAGLHADDVQCLENLLTPNTAKFSTVAPPSNHNTEVSPPARVVTIAEAFVPFPQEPEVPFKKTKLPVTENISGHSEGALPAVQLPQPTPPGPVEIHRLQARAYKIVDHLFPTGRRPQGQVTFQDFGRFMAAIGFGQVALGGSEYRFYKAGEEPQAGQNIVVHRRHPHPSYRASDLRMIGRRLTRRFGLTAEAFELQ